MLTCHNLEFQIENRVLFQNLGFTISAGGMLMIAGKNGSGKTTLLKMLSILIDMNEKGQIFWNKEQINRKNKDIFWQNIAYFGHKIEIYTHLTVLQNLQFWAKLRKTEMMIQPVMEIFKLHHVLNIKCCKLSCGWQKRVSLAKLMLFDAVLWILDEPFVNLDNEAQEILWNVLRSRAEQNGIVLFSNNCKIDIPKNIKTLKINDFLC